MKQEFKDRLKDERERLNLSQLQLAQRIDKKKKQSFISNFETGARKATSWIVEISHALGVDAYWLKTGEGERAPSGRVLSKDQETILQGFESSMPEMKDEWLDQARKRIEKAEQKKIPEEERRASNGRQ